jgi:hypothetical protein
MASQQGNAKNPVNKIINRTKEGAKSAYQRYVGWKTAVVKKIIDKHHAYREKANDKEYRKERRERWTIIGLFFAAGFAVLQWNELRKTDLTQEKTLTATHDLATAAKEQAVAMQGQLTVMQQAAAQQNRLITANEKLADATVKMSELAKKTAEYAERQLRAYVSILSGEIENFDNPTLGGTIQINNSGASAAKIRLWSEIRVLPVTIENFPKINTKIPPTEISLGPNTVATRPIRRSRQIPDAQRAGVHGGAYGIYAYGEYRFTDDTKIAKRCYFRLFYENRGRDASEGALSMYPTRGGNSCEDEK